ncbi:MAG: IPT/TIG domain-containing protein [Planctomycetes bacterium]|nr:IPT/TIG domain-containing protein [Planctomycetota bacterium]
MRINLLSILGSLLFLVVPAALQAQADLTGVSPNQGPTAGGQFVTLTGTGFTGSTGVDFGANPATGLVVVNDTTITVNTPAGSVGQVDVTVLNPGGNDTEINGYEYLAGPSIATVVPNAGPLAGGTGVTITGTGFTGVTGVTFDAVTGTGITVVNDTTITVNTPAHAAGQVDVVVTHPTLGSDTEVSGFEYVAAPIITNINPATGTTAGGDSITITGSGFVGVTSVTFDGTPGLNLNVTGPTSLTVDTPAHAAGQVDVVVNAAGGSDTAVNGFDYQTPANPAPTFTVMGGGGPITTGGNLNVVQGTTVSAANIQITVNDASVGGTLTLTAAITNVGTTGIVQTQFEGNSVPPAAINANPSNGTFDTLTTHAVTLTANDGVNPNVVFTFNIVVGSAPTITVSQPNGGESFLVGGNMTVTWSSSGVTGNVDILLSTNSGSSYLPTPLASATANDGSQVITVPNNPATTCRVRVRDTNTGLIMDDSNGDFTIATPAPAAVTLSAQGNPGSGTATAGSSRTALGFRLNETGGQSAFTVNTVTVRVTVITDLNAGASAINSISLRRGGSTLATMTSATWTAGGGAITLNFTALNSVIAAGGNGDFTLLISFSGGAVPSPNPIYQADITPSDVNSGTGVAGANITGGTITLVEKRPGDPLDEDDDDDSCNLSTRGGPAWPLLFMGILGAVVALRRRKAEA